MPAPIPQTELERLQALERYRILDTPREEAFDRIAHMAARLFNVPVALVTLMDRDRQWYKACVGTDRGEVARELSFCGYTILSDEVVVVPDATNDPRFAANPFVTSAPGIRFYAGTPLRTSDGHNIGALCILDTVPRSFSPDAQATLADLAAVVVDELELRLALSQARDADAARHESDERFASAFHFSSIGMALVSLGGRWLQVNHALCKLVGYTEQTLLATDFQTITHADDLEVDLAYVRQLIAGEITCYEMEKRYIHRQGHHVWVLLSVSLVHDGLGAPRYFIAQIQDITQRKQAEEVLQQAKAEAEQANHAKTEFLSRMSHELRTPLNAILGFGQLLELESLTPDQADSVAYIRKAGQHLLALIDEVLDIARIEADRLALSLEAVPITETVGEALLLAQSGAARRNIRIRVCEDGHGYHVVADHRRLMQVMLNLLTNAVKYNRDAGTVSISYRPMAHDRLRIEVQDTGRGIPPDKLGRLFEPFDRLGAEHGDVEGAGLGLALSQRLVAAMGGVMGVESTVGQGSTFWLEFALAEDPVVRQERLGPQPPLLDVADAGQRTILYIEDNLSNVTLIERVLEHRPAVKLLAALQGRLGFELACEQAPDLILLDLHLPDLSGSEVLQSLQEHPATAAIPVVVVSADALPGQVDRLRAAGAAAYLTKPLDIKQFLHELDELLWPKWERV